MSTTDKSGMSKKPTPSIGPLTAQDIASFVDKGDLALELLTYRAFREHGWWADHGHFYNDPIQDKPRQFDVQGGKDLRKNPATPMLPTTSIRIAAECKNVDPNRPVIVSRVPRSDSDSYHHLLRRFVEPSGQPHVTVIKSSPHDAKPYHVNTPVGKSIVQYSGTNDKPPEDPYAKWSQALGSCASLVIKTHAEAFMNRTAPDLCFIMPALVLADGALWTVDYDENGVGGEPTPANETTFFVGRDYGLSDFAVAGSPKYWVSHLHIYTKSGFVKALQTLNNPQHSTEFDRYFRFGMGLESG